GQPGASNEQDVDLEPHKVGGACAKLISCIAEATLDDQILANHPAELSQRQPQRVRRDGSRQLLWARSRTSAKHSHASRQPRLLRLSGERRGEDHSTCSSEERTPIHYWITSSARPSSDGGIVRPSALAVLRLMTSSNLIGCSTGRSAGLAP